MSSRAHERLPLELELMRTIVLVVLAVFAILVALPALIDLAARARL